MATLQDAVATFERNIEVQTGRPVSAWTALVRENGLAKHGQMVAWLKAEHGLSHSHANHVAKRTTEAAVPRSANDPAAHLFAGGKEGLRPIYDRLVSEAVRLGSDVEVAVKKGNTSLRRRKQFALLQPSTRTRVDVGLILSGRKPGGRLELAGSFNAMFTHRVKLGSIDDVDREVLEWLKEAYDEAA